MRVIFLLKCNNTATLAALVALNRLNLGLTGLTQIGLRFFCRDSAQTRGLVVNTTMVVALSGYIPKAHIEHIHIHLNTNKSQL